MNRDFDAAQELFVYDNGQLRWKADRYVVLKSGNTFLCAKAGEPAGTPHAAGYWAVRLRGRLHLAHRVVWLMHYGSWPRQHIDHINGVKTDNRVTNLRQCNDSQNGMNRGAQANSKFGIKGVSWSERDQRWVARIMADGKYKSLGNFHHMEDAAAARAAASAVYHGEFARV